MRGDPWLLAAAGPWLGSIVAFFVLPLGGLVALSLTSPSAGGAVELSLANYATLLDLSTGRLDVLGRTSAHRFHRRRALGSHRRARRLLPGQAPAFAETRIAGAAARRHHLLAGPSCEPSRGGAFSACTGSSTSS
ncbi:MAG: hypothetical protein M5U09_03645 [Gammaproteobacteria bacterium]|nr:hypothetical protein [Gammaproteobacteria bacterium]